MSGEAFGIYQPSPLSLMFRPDCDDCGSERLQWSTFRALARKVLLDLVPNQMSVKDKNELPDLLNFFGAGADAWCCLDCGKIGIFGGDESGYI